jgi:hypothetical protein
VERVAASIRREVSELLVTGIKDERVNLGMRQTSPTSMWPAICSTARCT